MNAPVKTQELALEGRRLDPLREAEAVRALRESLAAMGHDDEALLTDSIEGETRLFEIVDSLLVEMTETRGLVGGVEAVIGELENRRLRLQRRLDSYRTVIEQAMMVAELEKIERPAATLSLTRRPPKVEITEEADIPVEFWKPSAPSLDKKALGAALKDGRPIPGACLSNAAPTLTVRVL